MKTLLIIDMQEGSLADSDKYDVDGVARRINHLAQSIRVAGGKVVFIQHDGTAEENLAPGTPGWQLLSLLQVQPDDLTIRKTTNDAFYQTSLADMLTALDSRELIICGWATDQCVDSTVRAAISREYAVTVASDCHTVSDRTISAEQVIAHHNGIWTHLLTPGEPIRVITAAEIISQLR